MIDVLMNGLPGNLRTTKPSQIIFYKKICRMKSYIPVGSMLVIAVPEFELSMRIVQYKLIYDGMAKVTFPTYEYCLCEVVSLYGPSVKDVRTFLAGYSDGSRLSDELMELISSRQDVVIEGVKIHV